MKNIIDAVVRFCKPKPRELYWSLYIATPSGNYFEIVHENRLAALEDKKSLEAEGFEVEIVEQSDYSPWFYDKGEDDTEDSLN